MTWTIEEVSMREKVIDCRSNEGVTIGLIDAIITIAHTLSDRDLDTPSIKEALEDLRSDRELKDLLKDNTRNYYEMDNRGSI